MTVQQYLGEIYDLKYLLQEKRKDWKVINVHVKKLEKTE